MKKYNFIITKFLISANKYNIFCSYEIDSENRPNTCHRNDVASTIDKQENTTYVWTHQQTSNTIKNGPLEIYKEKLKLSGRNDLLQENPRYKNRIGLIVHKGP